MMDRWNNGAKGAYVKKIIDQNFDNLDTRISQIANQVANIYVRPIMVSDWIDGVIFINYADYNKSNPCVDVYIKNGDSYALVYGGYDIKNNGIELQSDLPFEGRVVIR